MSLRSMQLDYLNPHILCVLCGGYLVDATTIVECLHSFCRSCIVKYLQTSYNCPVCDVEVHKTKPLLHIRPDRTLQDIVYKIVPGIYHEEVNRRKEFDANQTKESEKVENTVSTHEDEKVKESLPFEDPVCITLEYFRKTRNRIEKEIFPTRYLRCSSLVTVSVLKKFVITKFAIPETHITEIIRSDEILDDDLTMKEVCRIYGLYSKPFVDLQYVFLEKNETATPMEKPKIPEVKRKRIKKRKEGKKLLKKCVSSGAHQRPRSDGTKKSKMHTSHKSENAANPETAPVQARSLENERKENLMPTDMGWFANTNKEDLVPNQVPSLAEHESVNKENNVSPCTNMASETSASVNDANTPFQKWTVDHDAATVIKIDDSSMVMSAVNGSMHVRSGNSEKTSRDSRVFNYPNEVHFSHTSGELESSASLQGLLQETS
ncbi:uncharacterized protein LOC141882039 isoform X2 [Acropora palmata]